LGQYTKRKDPPFFFFFFLYPPFFVFFFKKANNGLKTKKGSTIGHEQTKKKMMRLLGQLSVGTMGQEPKRPTMSQKKEKEKER